MTKRTSVILLCIVSAIVLFLGIFAFIPDTIEYGEYNEYYSPITLIQKSNFFTESVRSTYIVELEEGTTNQKLISALKSRFANIYGYYNISFENCDNKLIIVAPQTNNKQKTSVASILTNVTQNGKLEILATQTYAEGDVILSLSDMTKAKVKHYSQNGNEYYICQVSLTSEGTTKAQKLSSGSNYVALDGEVDLSNFAAAYTDNSLQIYCNGQELSKFIASVINKGTLGAKLSLETTDTKDDDETLEKGKTNAKVFLIIFAVIVLASFVWFIVRYKALGIAGILSQAIAIILAVLFAAYISFGMFNVASAIAMIVAYLFMTFFTIFAFEKITHSDSKTFGSAKYNGFLLANKLNLIAHGVLLLLGIILWVIPTAVTAPIGNIFVYSAVVSFIATMGLNRMFASVITPFCETKAKLKK